MLRNCGVGTPRSVVPTRQGPAVIYVSASLFGVHSTLFQSDGVNVSSMYQAVQPPQTRVSFEMETGLVRRIPSKGNAAYLVVLGSMCAADAQRTPWCPAPYHALD